MNKFTIIARHAAFGFVDFTIPADSQEEAFAKFKQIVYSIRQWSVSSNRPALDIDFKDEEPKPGDPIPDLVTINGHWYAHDCICPGGGEPDCDCDVCEEIERGW